MGCCPHLLHLAFTLRLPPNHRRRGYERELKAMKRWYLPSIAPSSEKRVAREPGADAPRVPSVGHQSPRVLFSSPECRLVVLDLRSGETMGDHHVRECAVVQVVSGRVSIEASATPERWSYSTLASDMPCAASMTHVCCSPSRPGPRPDTMRRQRRRTTSACPSTRPSNRSIQFDLGATSELQRRTQPLLAVLAACQTSTRSSSPSRRTG